MILKEVIRTHRLLKKSKVKHRSSYFVTATSFCASCVLSLILLPISIFNVFIVMGHEYGHFKTADVLGIESRKPFIFSIAFFVVGNVKIYQASQSQARMVAIAGPIAGITCAASLIAGLLFLDLYIVMIWISAILLGELTQIFFSKDGSIYESKRTTRLSTL